MTITTMPTIFPQQEKRKAEPIRETKHPNDNKTQIKPRLKPRRLPPRRPLTKITVHAHNLLNQQW